MRRSLFVALSIIVVVGFLCGTSWDQPCLNPFAASGDTHGPSSSTDGNVAVYDGATGKAITDSGISGYYVTPAAWKREGVVIYPPSGGGQALEPTLIAPEGDPHVLADNSTAVWKMWHSSGAGVIYEESLDGVHWTPYNSSTPVVASKFRPFVVKDSGTYHLYCTADDRSIDHYTSADGVTFTLAHAAVITGNMGGWNVTELNNNSSGIVSSGIFYFYVEQYPVGIALYTSTDFHTFTPVSLVIPGRYQGPTVPIYSGSTWYMWVGKNIDDTTARFGVQRWCASALTGPWANCIASDGYDLLPFTADEGVSTDFEEVIDPAVIEVNNKVYLYYTGNQGTTATPQLYQLIKLAVADMPVSQLVKTSGGSTISGASNLGNMGLSWDYAYNNPTFGSYKLKANAIAASAGLSVGSTYMNTTPPSNSLIVADKLGVGVSAPTSVASFAGYQTKFMTPRSSGTAVLKVRMSSFEESAIGTAFIEHDAYGDVSFGATRTTDPATLGHLHFFAAGVERLTIYGNGIFSVPSGTAPSTSPPDATQTWVQDYLGGAGDARLHIMGEASAVAKSVLGSGKIGVTGTTGGLTRQLAEATSGALSGASGSIAVNVPSGARILGVQLRVDTAITSDTGVSWSAVYVNTPTTAIASGLALTKNTKYNAIHPAYEITTGTVTITVAPNAGNFTAGVVRAIVYYEALDAMANAP